MPRTATMARLVRAEVAPAAHFFGACSASTSHLPRPSTKSTHSVPSAQWVVCFFCPVKEKWDPAGKLWSWPSTLNTTVPATTMA